MKIDRVVARYKGGSLIKGEVYNFLPEREFFYIRTVDGNKVMINFEELKGLYFIKNYEGDAGRKDRYQDSFPWDGKKLKITFTDREKLVGYAPHYSSGANGFFVRPADAGNNNNRIFVINSSVEEVLYL